MGKLSILQKITKILNLCTKYRYLIYLLHSTNALLSAPPCNCSCVLFEILRPLFDSKK